MKAKFTIKLYWCIHHKVLLEVNTEPIKSRIKYIKKSKDPYEVPLRLKALRPVKRLDLLPEPIQRCAKEIANLILRRERSWQEQLSRGECLWGYRDQCRYEFLGKRLQSLTLTHIKRCRMRHRKECPGVPFDYISNCWNDLGGLQFWIYNRKHNIR